MGYANFIFEKNISIQNILKKLTFPLQPIINFISEQIFYIFI